MGGLTGGSKLSCLIGGPKLTSEMCKKISWDLVKFFPTPALIAILVTIPLCTKSATGKIWKHGCSKTQSCSQSHETHWSLVISSLTLTLPFDYAYQPALSWLSTDSLADLRGAPGTCTRPLGPISFIFMQFSRKIWPNNRLVPPPWGLTPPSFWEILDPPLRLDKNYLVRLELLKANWFPRANTGFSHRVRSNFFCWKQIQASSNRAHSNSL